MLALRIIILILQVLIKIIFVTKSNRYNTEKLQILKTYNAISN